MPLPYPRLDPGGAAVVPLLLVANTALAFVMFGPGADPALARRLLVGGRLVVGPFQDAARDLTLPWGALPRLLTHGVLHLSWGHLAFNTAPLAVLGWLTARRIGGLGLLACYLAFTGVAGLAYAAVAAPNAALVGASGAVHGLAGLWLVWAWTDRRGMAWRAWPSVTWALFIALVHVQIFRTMGAGFAWQLHGFGLLAGMALAPLLPACRTP